MSKGITLLIVDDNVDNQYILAAMLEDDDVSCRFAASGVDALQQLEQQTVDLVLLDVMMPGMDGYETCRQIRSRPNLADLPIVMVTALDDREARIKGIEAGADDFLSKPIDEDELHARVRSITQLNRYGRLQQQAERVSYLESYDPLTDLPNRHYFVEQLAQQLKSDAAAEDGNCVVLCIGLDGFDVINDALGIDGGDQLLRQVSNRLTASTRHGDVLARLGARFLLLVDGGEDPAKRALEVADDVQAALSEALYSIDNIDLGLTASVGISLASHDGRDAESLVANAASALRQALTDGSSKRRFFSEAMNEAALQHLATANRLREALHNEDLQVHYLPRFNLAEGHCTGVEAQLFWRDQGYPVPVSEQELRIAEQIGIGDALDDWLLKRVVDQLVVWQRQELMPPPVAIATTPALLARADLALMLADARDAVGGSAEIELILQESALHAADPATLTQTLEQMQALGFTIAVDQFGRGNMSLAQLARLPVDVLNIGAELIRGVPESVSDTAVAKALTGLAHGLERRALAKNVETEEQRIFLLSWGCDEVQGPLFDQPQTGAALGKRWRADAAEDEAAKADGERGGGGAAFA